MRGERIDLVVQIVGHDGSSPHARGTRDGDADVPRERRIIPACAGNASGFGSVRAPVADHPRMRGERALPRGCTMTQFGSSPHARGTRDRDRQRARQRRIIPACAGNAGYNPVNPPISPDHPRMRGERGTVRRPRFFRGGSSPHARGTLHHQVQHDRAVRIIPACAGNAVPPAPQARVAADHPRMRGERAEALATQLMDAGSSPHARGTPG